MTDNQVTVLWLVLNVVVVAVAWTAWGMAAGLCVLAGILSMGLLGAWLGEAPR